MDWADSSPGLFTRRKMGNLLCARVIAPFSAAVCYFASDLGGMRAVATLLAEQAVEKPPSDLPETVLPHVLVIVETASQDFDATVTESGFVESVVEIMRSLKRYRREGDVHDALGLHYKQVRIIGLRRGTDVKSRATALRRRIVTMSKEASVARAACRLSFRLSHVQGLVGYLLDQFCRDYATLSHSCGHLGRWSSPPKTLPRTYGNSWTKCRWKFSCSIWSRLWLHLPCYWRTIHLAHTVSPHAGATTGLTPSAVFPPILAFKQLYKSASKAAVYERAVQPLVRKSLLAAIERDFESLFEELASASGDRAAAALHLHRLQSLHVHLRDLRSHKTCLSCFLRTPEKVFDYGHALCDTCIKTYGKRSNAEKYTFAMTACILCGAAHHGPASQMVPPTAGVRMLSLDGGGVRGVIPLVFLDRMEQLLSDLRCPLGDFLDFVCGISAGGLIVKGLFIMRWTSKECLEKFQGLAMKTFKRRNRGPVLLNRLHELAVSYLRDWQYSSCAIEDAFRSAFGSQVQLFNPSSNDTKVAVTTTTAREALPCLFFNYNGGIRPPEIGKVRVSSASRAV
ncbi:hypothetical protein LTR28_010799 [Elasticomyces elasticus]|nr:hypothetical protein LTR28_010799 [Elasticomyces elasticus]